MRAFGAFHINLDGQGCRCIIGRIPVVRLADEVSNHGAVIRWPFRADADIELVSAVMGAGGSVIRHNETLAYPLSQCQQENGIHAKLFSPLPARDCAILPLNMADRTFTRKDFEAWGAKGGTARAARLTPAQLSKIGKIGAKARKQQLKAQKAADAAKEVL